MGKNKSKVKCCGTCRYFDISRSICMLIGSMGVHDYNVNPGDEPCEHYTPRTSKIYYHGIC